MKKPIEEKPKKINTFDLDKIITLDEILEIIKDSKTKEDTEQILSYSSAIEPCYMTDYYLTTSKYSFLDVDLFGRIFTNVGETNVLSYVINVMNNNNVSNPQGIYDFMFHSLDNEVLKDSTFRDVLKDWVLKYDIITIEEDNAKLRELYDRQQQAGDYANELLKRQNHLEASRQQKQVSL